MKRSRKRPSGASTITTSVKATTFPPGAAGGGRDFADRRLRAHEADRSDNALEVYTDGACCPNPGRGGWAFHVPATGLKGSGAIPGTTSNRMELEAIRQALIAVESPVVIFTDSRLSVEVLTGRWKAKKNRDLIDDIRRLAQGREVQYRWVKGHAGNPDNEIADRLANAAII